MRKFAWLLPLVLLAILALFLWQKSRSPATPSSPIDPVSVVPAGSDPVPAETEPVQSPDTSSQTDQTDASPSQKQVSRFLVPPLPPSIGAAPAPVKVFPFGAELSQSASADEDIQVVGTMLEHFRKHFSENPIGANWEITAALTGANPKQFGYINADHPAINKQGELCDRWGRPFLFHSESGTEMNVISLGPDGKVDTKDDISLYGPIEKPF